MAETNGLGEPVRLSADGLKKAHYSPPWANTSLIGIAGASGSGKTSLAVEVVKTLDLPWVIIMSIVSWQVVFLQAAADHSRILSTNR